MEKVASEKKLSVTHVNQALNESIQADFVVLYIDHRKSSVLVIVCIWTNSHKMVISKKQLFRGHEIKHGVTSRPFIPLCNWTVWVGLHSIFAAGGSLRVWSPFFFL